MNSNFWSYINTGLLLAVFEVLRVYGLYQISRNRAFAWVFIIVRLPVYIFVSIAAGLWPMLIPILVWIYVETSACIRWLKSYFNPEPF